MAFGPRPPAGPPIWFDRCHRPGYPRQELPRIDAVGLPTLRPHWRSLCLLGPVLAYNLLHRALDETSRRYVGRSVDFLLPLLSSETDSLAMVSPLHRSRAMPWLRSPLDEHWREHSSAPPS